ncbi:Hsp20/alpha crystallin family protein [Halorubrum sp. CBA1125]|uniref:Hsp20/alpha crystallin family protein n=1 Tax=Halorubrum sp. CBA1125 TaxID=2668072 RepID=UPI0012E8EB1F|nr:Hsp20/alpha crystallin family protein [Halorubrum sp. CBA1125]MUW16014.1 Hsp20/alpha crystallin family protein [Halorubrum sp. CBA1125]
MTLRQTQSAGDDAMVRRYEYDDSWIVAADLGVDREDVSVDTVGETAIVVIEGADEPVESEFDLPGPADAASVTNGVVTVVGSR